MPATVRIHVETIDGRPAVLRRTSQPGQWRIESTDRVGEWCGSIWTDRPAWSATMLDVEAAERYPAHRDTILSQPA